MTETTLSLAKTTQPTLSKVVERQHFCRKLDAHCAQSALWVCGPAGCGKTTAVANYVETRGAQTLWYQIDAADSDVATFFHYIRRSAIKHCPDKSINLPELHSEKVDWHAFSRRLFRAIFSSYAEPLIIVLDNFEPSPVFSELSSMLCEAIYEVPKGSKIILISRSDPPPEFARHQMNDLLSVLDGEDLKLQRDEFTQLAMLRHSELSSDALQSIYQLGAGWVAGSVLILEYSRRLEHFDAAAIDESGGLLFDYVASEVFATFDKATQEFLLDVCWPRRLNKEIAEGISEEPKASQILANLARNNYFVIERQVGSEREYALHPLLKSFLRSRITENRRSHAISALQTKTATVLASLGYPEEAVEMLVEHLDWDTLEPIIETHAPVLIRQGRAALVSKWLEELPRDRLEANAWLLYWYGKSREMFSARDARNYLKKSFDQFCKSDSETLQGKILAAVGVAEAIISEADDFSLLDDWGAVLSELSSQDPSNDYSSVAAIPLLMSSVLRNPKFGPIEKWFRVSEEAMKNFDHPVTERKYATTLALTRTLSGDFDWSNELTKKYRSSFTDEDQPRTHCEFLLVTALAMLLSGFEHEAQLATDECIAIADQHGIQEIRHYACAIQTVTALLRGDLQRADSDLGRLEELISPDNRTASFLFRYLRSWRALLENDLTRSIDDQRRAQAAAIELGNVLAEILSSTALAHLSYLIGDKRTGSAQLRRVHSIARDSSNPLLEFLTLLIFADVAITEGKQSRGLNALRYALGLGRQNQYFVIPWWNPEQLADLCAVALQNDIEVSYVKELIVRRNLIPSTSSIVVPDWPWPIAVNTFGQFKLTRFGETDEKTSTARSRPIFLFQILLALGVEEVSMRDVGTVMWPHVDEEYAIKSLTINLHRLRKALGSDDSISLQDGRLSVNSQRVSLDIDAFGKIVNAIQESTQGRLGVGDLDELAESLFGIYKGSFLPGVDGHQCLIDARERYRESFVEAVRALRDAYQRRGDRERSYDVLRRGLSRDLQSAELRADLIALFRSDGDSGSAKAVIEDYQHQLFTEGAGGLPADLKALYAEITNTEERES